MPSPRHPVVFEIVPTSTADGPGRLREEAAKVRNLFEEAGLWGQVNTILIPQLIAEEGDRPIALADKIDSVDAKRYLSEALPLEYILTQVSVFTPEAELRARIAKLRAAGVNQVVFVGVPRVFDPKDVVGPYPSQAVQLFEKDVPGRGVILIPTRPGEVARFSEKAQAGATFGLTQLLFSDHILGFLKELATRPERPQILLSFGYVPQLETTRNLIRWLIKDTTAQAQAEMAEVFRIASLSFKEKQEHLVGLVKQVAEQAVPLGFPLGLHFECPYGPSKPAMEVFARVLEAWNNVVGSGANEVAPALAPNAGGA